MSIISAGNTTTTALTQTADTSGNLVFTTGGANTVALTLSNTQAATFSSNVTVTGAITATGGVIQGANAAPAFSAYRTATQSQGATATTKIQFNLEDFDTNNNFDSTTNYRFTPTVAGYYQINWLIVVGNLAAGEYYSALYKNGSLWVWGNDSVISNTNYNSSTGSALVYMNGSTDYLDVYIYSASATTICPSTAFPSRFSGCLVRSA